MSNCHPARVYNNLREYLQAHCWKEETIADLNPRTIRRAKRIWKKHIEKHGNVPMIRKCSICSGEERKLEIKHGAWKLGRPTKNERDELKGESNE